MSSVIELHQRKTTLKKGEKEIISASEYQKKARKVCFSFCKVAELHLTLRWCSDNASSSALCSAFFS